MDVTSPLSLVDPLEPARKATAAMLKERDHTFSLPQPFYNDERLFQLDMQEIFHKEWLIAGMTCEIPAKGNYLTLQVGDNPVIVLRGAEGQVHAFHNVCRHRGSRLCVSDKGKVAKLVCPYHQWTYELDGRLLFAGTEMGADFDMKQYGLKPVHVKTAGGYIFISLAENPPAIDDFLSTLAHYMEPYDMENTKVAVQTTLREAANWKLVMENNRECYHCSGSHPELLNTLLEWDDVTDPRASQAFKDQVAACTRAWDAEKIPYAHASFGLRNRIVRMPLLEGTVSMTMDGKQGSKKLMGRIQNPDLGSMRILHLPHSWNHCMGDHMIVFTVWPIGPQETVVTTKWLVHKDAVEGVDYDVARLREVWDATNDQDRRLAEENQRGINSSAYQPGPYSKTYEFGVINFLDWYSERMLNNLGDTPATKLRQVGAE
ncbi:MULTISPECIES: glycine-betaine demethylase subunit GbcA [Pseudomonadaceae]|jgi:glycine betaine catabolism A|uniref:Glycine-betaine demethylase subunit GbcA n=1 Tax=Metapseudomonas otitidis TaxID=319939 RepID=A0A1I0SMZ6_9GAMM|nr:MULTISPECIES: glycine-betaine demethylase subunit GbcA [Pseudomonas]MDL5600180.1 glycine-betaine demethylase subunit GbcA [Bacillus subtilis]KIV67292.1 GbcA Glycine betaine demethylase subunit A [Pseudomonas sp. FeS53a]MBO2927283.1 glycine-betaine demethylase subunit GbcA [Pseudomonas otitidis]MCO7552796.1 glycine-betaine demethylase subunit GbcA [Pseudomonas otitidis]MCP1618976.1 Rieske 2Fe-2S family protein [Pseudomonas otitidis]